jgi:tRNA1Val (adenine37-N6)-methyltransferase
MFRFKQFTIIQKKSAMKVGTDGVLLGAWTDCYKAKSILDIGTGTGLIAIMAAQKNKSAHIDAVEINTNAYNEAVENIASCPWSSRISVLNIPFQKFANNNRKYDCIITNPPFFTQSKKAKTEQRTNARHNDTLPFDELIKGVAELLSGNGSFNIIIPSDSQNIIEDLCNRYGMFAIKKTFVKPTPDINAKRVLMSFSKKKKNCNETTIIIEQYGRHKYSKEYIELTKDFYLNF